MSQHQQTRVPVFTAGGSSKLPMRSGSGVTGISNTRSTKSSLPPRLTDDALISYYRLDISPHSILKWDLYKYNEDGNVEKLQDITETLLELRYAEYEACSSQDRSKQGVRDQHYLYNKTLWTTQSSKDGEGAIWIMRLIDKEQIAKSLTFASSEEEKSVSSQRGALDRKLSKCGFTRMSDQVHLQGFFSHLKQAHSDDPASLCPQEQYGQIHKIFLRSIEDLVISYWVWNQQRPEITPVAQNLHGKRTAKADTLKVEEGDEEEEGAIKDSSKQDRPIVRKDTVYWPKVSSAKILTRFKDGVIIGSPKGPTNALRSYLDNQDKIIHLSLRCTQDQIGHLYIITRPQSLSDLQNSNEIEIDNTEGVLAPEGKQVTLIERVNGLGWSTDKESEEVLQKGIMNEGKKKTDECLKTLRKMLQIRGVDIDLLDENWILCETDDHVRFLWPSKLCFIKRVKNVHQPERSRVLKLTYKPILDIGDRAKRLVKESLGIAVEGEVEDSIMLDEEERIGEGNIDMEEVDGADVEIDSDEEKEKGEDAADREQEPKYKAHHDLPQMKEEAIHLELKAQGAKQAQEDVLRATSPSIVSKAYDISRDDDETDLWGTFGFGNAEIDGKRLNRRQSATGLDEGGFGLITEDDFSFFDEATRDGGGGVFDDMNVDLQSQEDLLHSIEGETPIPPVEMDNISDMNTTNSASIDHPSLPGFTPGSFSATSPAVGGLNAKTPRTPFSPSQDLIDATIAIEGESDSMLYNRDQYDQSYHEGQLDDHSREYVTTLQEQQGLSTRFNSNEKQGWSAQSRNDLLSKYEQGKYALLDGPLLRMRNKEEGQQTKTKELSRNRLQHRGRHLQHRRRLSGVDRIHHLRKLTFPLTNTRLEEDASDIDATVDGGMSDRSSLMEEDSEEVESIISGDTSEDEGMTLEERMKYLHSSLQMIIKGKKHIEPTLLDVVSMDTSKERPARITSETELKPFLTLLLVNPQVYLVCSDKSSAETISRSFLCHLFSALPCQYIKSNLASLLCSTSEAASDIDSMRKSSTNSSLLSTLESPKIMIGCQGAITIMQSSALLYWERISLSPVSGPKNIIALALHCGSLQPSWQSELLNWFSVLRSTFIKMGLGSHKLVKEGLLGIGDSDSTSVAQILAQATTQSEQWSDTLESLLSRLELDLKRGRNVIIYTINLRISPQYSWIYPKLQADLRELARKRWKVAPDLIDIWPMAWSCLSSSIQCNPERNVSLMKMALSIYDSIQIPVVPNINLKKHLPYTQTMPIGVQYPYFTLLPSVPLTRCNTNFTLEWNAEPFNLLDSGLLLHVGYSVGKSIGELSLVAIMDEKAQGYHINGWRRKGDLVDEIELIWEEALNFAKRARILWRIVICKEQVMSMEEIQHWSFIISRLRDKPLRAIDITLTCIDLSNSMTFVLPRQSQSELLETISSTGPYSQGNTLSHFIRADQCNYAIYPPFRIDYSPSLANDIEGERNAGCILALQSSILVSISNRYNGSVMTNDRVNVNSCEWSRSAPQHKWIHIIQVYKTEYSSSSQDLSLASRIRLITESFHNLTFVARERLLASDNLPWHITVLGTARRACHLL